MAEERRVMAARDLAKKLRSEGKLKIELVKFFKNLGNAVRNGFAESKTIINADTFQPELQVILKNHYKRVMNQFRGDVVNNMKHSIARVEIKQDEEELLAVSTLAFIETQSRNKAQLITATNNEEIKRAFRKASEDLSEIEGFEAQVPATVLAAEAIRRFSVNSASRSDMIAVTETQNPAEAQKQNEMQALLFTGAISSFLTIKTWTSLLDDVVRDDHFEADGQTRNITEAFEVGGELLMRPGDTSLGASAGNVIRCRCSSSLTARA